MLTRVSVCSSRLSSPPNTALTSANACRSTAIVLMPALPTTRRTSAAMSRCAATTSTDNMGSPSGVVNSSRGTKSRIASSTGIGMYS